MNPLTLVVMGGIVLTAGDILFKYWIKEGASYLSYVYGMGMVVYMIGLVLLVESFKGEHMAVASALFVLVNVATLALVSWWYFGETLSFKQVLGLLLACISVLLLEWGAIKS